MLRRVALVIPEDTILHSHRRENLKSYNAILVWTAVPIQLLHTLTFLSSGTLLYFQTNMSCTLGFVINSDDGNDEAQFLGPNYGPHESPTRAISNPPNWVDDHMRQCGLAVWSRQCILGGIGYFAVLMAPSGDRSQIKITGNKSRQNVPNPRQSSQNMKLQVLGENIR
jgi:hypothetical protein